MALRWWAIRIRWIQHCAGFQTVIGLFVYLSSYSQFLFVIEQYSLKVNGLDGNFLIVGRKELYG